jgi:hypothetical protein
MLKLSNIAIRKSELYSSLWQSCGALGGGMDASPVQALPQLASGSGSIK